MRPRVVAIAAAAAVLVIAAVVLAVVLWPDDSSDAVLPTVTEPGETTTASGERSVVIRVLATVTSARPVDLPPRNVQNKGDRVFVESQLRNAVPQFGRPKGAIVGIDYSTITYLSDTERLVSVQITLPGGGLRLRGTIPVTDSTTNTVVKIPVVSGTRDFDGATGVSEVHNGPESQTLNVYRLRLPG